MAKNITKSVEQTKSEAQTPPAVPVAPPKKPRKTPERSPASMANISLEAFIAAYQTSEKAGEVLAKLKLEDIPANQRWLHAKAQACKVAGIGLRALGRTRIEKTSENLSKLQELAASFGVPAAVVRKRAPKAAPQS